MEEDKVSFERDLIPVALGFMARGADTSTAIELATELVRAHRGYTGGFARPILDAIAAWSPPRERWEWSHVDVPYRDITIGSPTRDGQPVQLAVPDLSDMKPLGWYGSFDNPKRKWWCPWRPKTCTVLKTIDDKDNKT